MKQKSKTKPRVVSRRLALRALTVETDRALRDQIRRVLALPMEKRTHFLRARLSLGASAL